MYEPKYLKLWKHPDCYLGATWPEYYVVIGQHRDSDSLTRSNFRIAKAELEAIEAKYPEWDNPTDHDTAMLVNPYEGHWAVGHIEWLGIHKDSPEELIIAADSILARIESYPALSEDDWSNLEYEEAMTFWESMSLASKVDYCRDCNVSIFAARRNSDLPDSLWESLTSN
jgi:hypothetical protein